MELREAIPPAVIGAIITFMIVGIAFIGLQEAVISITQNAMSQTMAEDVDVIILIFTAAIGIGFMAGGFAAAYLSTRNFKERLTASCLTGGLSGFVSAVAFGAITILLTPETFIAVPAAIVIGAGMGVLGGTANALLLGKGKSHLSSAIGNAWHSMITKPIIFLPPLVFIGLLTILGYALEGFTIADPNTALAVDIIVALIAVLFTAFTATGIVLASHSKHNALQLLKASILKSKGVIVGGLALIVPLTLLAGIALMAFLTIDPTIAALILTPIGAWIAAAALTGVMVAVMAFGFLPQAAVLRKADGITAPLRDSFRFSKKHVPGVFALYALLAGISIIVQIGLMVIQVMQLAVPQITMLMPGIEFLSSLVLITFALSAMTNYYSLERN